MKCIIETDEGKLGDLENSLFGLKKLTSEEHYAFLIWLEKVMRRIVMHAAENV